MRIVCFISLLLVAGCYEAEKTPAAGSKKKPFILGETIITGRDSGMKTLAAFSTGNVADVLCQHWVGGYGNDVGEFSLFKDSTVLENPRTDEPRVGRWRLQNAKGYRFLILQYPDKKNREYVLREVKPGLLTLGALGTYGDVITRRYEADGMVHENMHSDPFHPVNNQWRITPKKPESDSAINARARGLVKFYALYFRDNIKRQKKVINFEGLPTVFRWYSGGIGLVDRDEMPANFVACFYNRNDAVKAHKLLRRLIVDFEFDWPKDAPNWVYETQPVLEQMYHKMGY